MLEKQAQDMAWMELDKTQNYFPPSVLFSFNFVEIVSGIFAKKINFNCNNIIDFLILNLGFEPLIFELIFQILICTLRNCYKNSLIN